MRRSIYPLIDLIFPHTCPVCGVNGSPYPEPICLPCKHRLIASPPPIISSTPEISQIYSCSAYDNIVREVLKQLKFRKDLAMLKTIGSLLKVTEIKMLAFSKNTSIIIPVPLHRSRKRKRGFNQSEALATLLSKCLGLPVCNNVLVKNRNTPPQSSLSRSKRLKNLRTAFAVKNASKIKALKILLLDDVTTTGATLDTCAKELYKAGASEVRAFTIAKTM